MSVRIFIFRHVFCRIKGFVTFFCTFAAIQFVDEFARNFGWFQGYCFFTPMCQDSLKNKMGHFWLAPYLGMDLCEICDRIRLTKYCIVSLYTEQWDYGPSISMCITIQGKLILDLVSHVRGSRFNPNLVLSLLFNINVSRFKSVTQPPYVSRFWSKNRFLFRKVSISCFLSQHLVKT
jgi:hypothetical protein